MVSRRGWLLPVALVVTAVVCAAAIGITGLVACGVSGCRGGGFGPVFAPVPAQVGLVVVGMTLVPLALLVLRGRSFVYRAVAVVVAVALGSGLAMVVLGLGPNGCPWGQTRTITGTDAFAPGALTCSGDRDGVRDR